MKWISITMVMVLLIVGCSNPTVITINRTINHTIYKNNTIYINNTIIEPCNVTGPEINISFDRSYTLELIRRIKYLEGQQNKYFNNNSDCDWELNQSNIRRKKAEDELCDNWNSTWCQYQSDCKPNEKRQNNNSHL